MLKSMTAFGRARSKNSAADTDITVEIRSVNSRYLDCTVKLPKMYSALEDKIKSRISSRGVSRGKLEVYLGIEQLAQTGLDISLDPAVTTAYINALRTLRDEYGLKDDISVMRVAANKDIFITKKPDEDPEALWNDVLPVLDEALDMFIAAREKEGDSLKADLYKKLENIRTMTESIAKLSDDDIKGYEAKLEARIKQFLSDFEIDISEQRILTEAAIYADRVAIDEELVRLDTHFKAFCEIVEKPEPAGRKLDFLLQEINRETNTIGSKANNIAITRLVVDMKSELEKIREQIQNIE